MSSLSRELVFLILQFLDEEKFKETVHKLEQESGFFFNMRYFEDMVTSGEWEEVEKYLSGFTKVDDNRYSMKIFFEIRKQKYLEALDKRDRAKAVEILVKDLKVFAAFNEDLFKEITQLLTLENFRDNEQLSKYGDTKSARGIMLAELKKLIEANPLFRDKLQFPPLKNSRLRTLINQSLNWQHQLCKNPRPNPDIKTLFVDHTCATPNGARAPSPVTNPLMGAVPKAGGFPPLSAHGPFQPTPAALPTSLAGWMANPSSVPHPSASAGPIGLAAANNAAMSKRPRTPTNNPAMDYQTADSEHVMKRARPFGMSDEVNNLPVNVLPVQYTGQSHGQSSYTSSDLPKTVVMTLNQGSAVKSMDFHPVQQILLLVGTNMGEVMVWELGSRERIASKNFKVWDTASWSVALQASLANDYTASVNRVVWSPDGNLFGVAYSKHIVHIYSYHGGDDLRNHLEIEAHAGSVNDLAFSYPNKQLCVVTCGEDRVIKVWDVATGTRQYTFEGHEAPVYSVCPHHKENIQVFFFRLYLLQVSRLIYTNSGLAILALASNAVHKLWKWQRNDRNSTGKATASVSPQLWQPPSGILMTNDVSDTNPEDAVSCFALSKNDSYVMSASGGKISLFNMMTFKTMTTFMPPPPAATFLAFHPQDNNIIAIGMEDSSIQIYNVRVDEVKTKLKGHQKRITGLAFSHNLNVLVSSGADSQLCVWNTDGWEKQASKSLQMPGGRAAAPLADTRVQFHLDQMHLLVVHETQIALYDAPKLECLKQWAPREISGPITHATYSCDGQSIYVSFEDGSVGVLTAATLRLRCRINQNAYLPPNPSLRVHPLVIAAHPSEPNQFALGLTDGGVHILEPLESEGKWGTSPPTENGTGPSSASGAAGSDQPQR
ncbi:topless-related protein 4 [Quercus suber]|uniref:topless-related protein 4 n=1 Tax=Quercus suber TaxID=58331 RepID=UPI0032DE7C74